MLIKLPNGDWIDPKTIAAMRVLEQSADCDERVAIHHAGGVSTIVPENVHEFMDELAQKANAE